MRRTEIIILLRVGECTGVVQFANHQVTLVDNTIHTRVIADNGLNRGKGVVRQQFHTLRSLTTKRRVAIKVGTSLSQQEETTR